MVVMAQHNLDVNSEDGASPGGAGKRTDLQQHLQVSYNHTPQIIGFIANQFVSVTVYVCTSSTRPCLEGSCQTGVNPPEWKDSVLGGCGLCWKSA